MAFLSSWVSQEPSFLYGGLIDDSLVGFAAYTLLAPEAELIDIRLDAGCRGHGYGRVLLAHTLQEMFELGAETVLLEVRVSNLAAQSLYKSSGFVEYGVRRNYYHATNGAEDAILMRLDNLGSHRA